MSLTIEFSEPLITAIHEEAARQGVPPEELVEKLVSENLPPVQRKGSLSALIQSWIDEGDEEEQRETWEALKEGIDANRVGQRKIFH